VLSNRDPVGPILRAPKTAELIASYVRGQVVRGELKPGDGLPSETVLMEMFGVSRPTLREAFRILEAESLISVRRGARGGARVVSPDVVVAARYVGLLLQLSGTTLADVYQARMMIESAAAGLLAARRTRHDLDELAACLEPLERPAESDTHVVDADSWSQAAGRLHDLVLDRAGNRTLAVQARMLREVMAMHLPTAVLRTFDRPDTRDQARKLLRSYRKLVLLIDARDPEGAQRHWRTHLEIAGRRLFRDDLGAKEVLDLFGSPADRGYSRRAGLPT
jgi:GntR family transcriptional regulator, transcriptional repressor for pyruvate dehydrogenase complex